MSARLLPGVNASYALVGGRLELRPHTEWLASRLAEGVMRGAAAATDEALLAAARGAGPGLHEVAAVVAGVLGVPLRALYGRSQRSRACLARHMAWHLGRSVCGASWIVLGREFGRDHSTAQHGALRAGRLIREDVCAAAAVVRCLRRLAAERWDEPDGALPRMAAGWRAVEETLGRAR